jgi:hypothetical protein
MPPILDASARTYDWGVNRLLLNRLTLRVSAVVARPQTLARDRDHCANFEDLLAVNARRVADMLPLAEGDLFDHYFPDAAAQRR